MACKCIERRSCYYSTSLRDVSSLERRKFKKNAKYVSSIPLFRRGGLSRWRSVPANNNNCIIRSVFIFSNLILLLFVSRLKKKYQKKNWIGIDCSVISLVIDDEIDFTLYRFGFVELFIIVVDWNTFRKSVYIDN